MCFHSERSEESLFSIATIEESLLAPLGMTISEAHPLTLRHPDPDPGNVSIRNQLSNASRSLALQALFHSKAYRAEE
jgi:hypothetical protein